MGLWRMIKEARQKNAALRTYMDEIESKVRRQLQESGEIPEQHRIHEMFLEEIGKTLPTPGLPESEYWGRAMLLSEMKPRVAALRDEFQ